MMKAILYAAAALIGSVLASPVIPTAVAENNWANWRGPHYNGSIETANPPTQWDNQTNVKWKVPLPGKGSGTPVVWEDQIILLTAVDTGQPDARASNSSEDSDAQRSSNRAGRDGTGRDDTGQGGRGQNGRGRRGFLSEPAPKTIHEFIVLSLSLEDGSLQWQTVVNQGVPHEGGHRTSTFASASAVTDGKRIFASFGSNGIFCLDMQGELIWSKQLGKMTTRNAFGEGSSPALSGDTLVVPWDHEGQSRVYALVTSTGDVKWNTDRDQPTTWSTPLIVEYEGTKQVVMNGNTVYSYDLADGKFLWSCGGQVTNPIPSPVQIDDSVVCMTGYRGNAVYSMPLSAEGDITDTDQVRWHRTDAGPYVASPTLYKGQLYFTKGLSGIVTSVDARTGEVTIPPTRLESLSEVYASPVAAANKIYFTSRKGITVVIEHGSALKQLAVNDLGEPVDASPAIVGDAILIRGSKHLHLIER